MVSTRSAASPAAPAAPWTGRATALRAGAGRRRTGRTATLEQVGVVGGEARLEPELGRGGAQAGLDLGGPALGGLELEVHGVHRVGLAHHPGLEVDDVDLVGGQ